MGVGKSMSRLREIKRAGMGEKWEVGLQVGLQSGVTFSENWGYKTLARAYPVRGEEKAKIRSKV